MLQLNYILPVRLTLFSNSSVIDSLLSICGEVSLYLVNKLLSIMLFSTHRYVLSSDFLTIENLNIFKASEPLFRNNILWVKS